MCGIIAYKGFRNGVDIVLEGLKLLEYRGYDSWGIAAKNKDIHVFKEIGKIGEIEKVDLPMSNICMGHTRWSTTGAVTKENSHPHLSCDNKRQLLDSIYLVKICLKGVCPFHLFEFHLEGIKFSVR